MTRDTVPPPKRIHVDRTSQTLEIAWDDMSGLLSLPNVRKMCPCALCDELRDQQNQSEGLHMISTNEMPSAILTEIIPVGNYAIQLRWQDGHDTGIYTYGYLRELIGTGSDSD